MNLLLLALALTALAAVIWLFLRWAGIGRDASGESDDADHYTSLLNLYAQDCAQHLDAAQNPERSWEERMKRLNQAEEAKQQHADTLGEAPTDMRGRELVSPPSAQMRTLRQNLFRAGRGHPDLPWSVLQNDEKIEHAQQLERGAVQLRTYGDVESAEAVTALAETIYRDLVDREVSDSTPYIRLADLYRCRKEIDREADVLQQGLDHAHFDSDDQRRTLEDRLEHLRQRREV